MRQREDQPAEDKLLVPQSFYLNMTNCIPEEGHFAAVTTIVLQKKTSKKALVSAFLELLKNTDFKN